MTSPHAEPRPLPEDARQPNANDSPSLDATWQHPDICLPPLDRRVRKVVALFGEDLTRRWTLDDFAAEVGVTARHLERLFKADTGFTPLQLLKALRLERAALALAQTGKAVKEVAAEVGYRADTKHFHRDFKAEYGVAPGAYRQMG